MRAPRGESRLLPILLLALAPALQLSAASPPAVRGHGGAIASSEATATAAGLELLAQGGNAVDAAVATALALAVVHPQAGNLGGGGFAVVRIDDELATLDFREVAPAAATRDMYLDTAGEAIADASTVGALAAGVPGSPKGLFALHQRFGARPWAEVVAPALRLARDGFPVTRRLHEAIAEDRSLLARFPTTAAVWLPGGEPPPIGSLLRLPALAATLAAYAAGGPESLSSGPAAAAVERTAAAHGGILTAADLAAYEPVWRAPLRLSAYGWSFATMDLPSSGGIILGQTLAILEGLDWGRAPRFGAERAHLLTETWRRVYADRVRLGDPATSSATAAQLLAPGWLARRQAEIGPRATPSDEVLPWSREAAESSATTHLSVIDGAGNMVALTTTLNGSFGSGLLVPELGFLLNNEMDDFATAPGRPNAYGLIQGEENAVRAGRRMLSSMTPTLAWKGTETLAVGGWGGSKIPSATTQVLLNLIVDGDELQEAVNRPRMHHQWQPDRIDAELDALSPETADELRRRGHTIAFKDLSAVVTAVRQRADGSLEAAPDPRGPGAGGVLVPEVPAPSATVSPLPGGRP
jgi:gamma-glutamyltranspeptidase/glutathione hydrolase